MAKNEKRIWLSMTKEMHDNLIQFAKRDERSIQGQARHYLDLGMDWGEKITNEIENQYALRVEAIRGKKNLLSATPSKEVQSDKERRQA